MEDAFRMMLLFFLFANFIYLTINSLHQVNKPKKPRTYDPLPMARTQHAWGGLLCFIISIPTFITTFPTVDASNRSISLLEMSTGVFYPSNPSLESMRRGRPVCDPIRAGGPLQRASCEEAVTKIPTGNDNVRFARRGPTIYDVQIPRRYSSCTSS